MNIRNLIDHTLLKPEATAADIARLCGEAREFDLWSVCVNPFRVRQAAAALAGSDVKVCTVVGFPLGASLTEAKVNEAQCALRDGATEIDMVLNIGALKEGDDAVVLADVQSVVQVCREVNAICKVIFETCLLTQEEKGRACELCVKAGADFVKTSTGFSSGGATVEDVALMSRLVKPRGLGVKASGTSNGVRIVQEAAVLKSG
jgi:deoxyribose-phosphate aldolase